MTGSIVLCGGNEFEPESLPISRAILKLIRRDDKRVIVFPAAVDNPRKTSKQGLAHFRALNITAEAMLISGEEGQGDASQIASAIEVADLVYLSDSNPFGVVELMQDQDVFFQLQQRWENGAVVAASGASAMALCDLYWDSGEWVKGLGLFKGIVVIPHHEYVMGRFSRERLRQNLPDEYTILGIDDTTAAIITGQQAQVVGAETVTVYRVDDEAEYAEGERFSL